VRRAVLILACTIIYHVALVAPTEHSKNVPLLLLRGVLPLFALSPKWPLAIFPVE